MEILLYFFARRARIAHETAANPEVTAKAILSSL
jgi:hypothetical protein